MSNSPDMLQRLHALAEQRKSADPETSYVARLHAKGTSKIAQKVGEEAVETALAAVSEGRDKVVSESADLLFHLTVLWSHLGIEPAEVMAELARREGISGISEKASRKEDRDQ
ncbi:MAG: phosphoribosyl-ATP pyrophosphatase [Minwuia thermotolerans]|nr:MAG: phosphoribosyl-ATP pyrophosphatase [Minwuia thermotolerans]